MAILTTTCLRRLLNGSFASCFLLSCARFLSASYHLLIFLGTFINLTSCCFLYSHSCNNFNLVDYSSIIKSSSSSMNTSRIACASSSSTPSNSAKVKKFSTSSDDKNASEQSICKQRVKIPSFSVASTCLAASSKCAVSSSPDICSVAAMAASKSCVRVFASKRSPMSATSDCSNSQYSPSAQTDAARNDANALEFVFMFVIVIK